MRAGAPGVTLSVAVALVSPGDDTVTLALPIEVGVKLEVATPASAIAAGASYLVVGRPITGAPDPLAAAEQIIAEMQNAEVLQTKGTAP